MIKFKSGDKVICIKSSGIGMTQKIEYYTRGKIYTVKDIKISSNYKSGFGLFTEVDNCGITTNGWEIAYFIPATKLSKILYL